MRGCHTRHTVQEETETECLIARTSWADVPPEVRCDGTGCCWNHSMEGTPLGTTTRLSVNTPSRCCEGGREEQPIRNVRRNGVAPTVGCRVALRDRSGDEATEYLHRGALATFMSGGFAPAA